MDNELIRNIFGQHSQSDFISREIDRQIALLREQSERHVFVDGGRIYNTIDDRNVSIWHDGNQESLNYQGRHLVDALTEQLLGKVEMVRNPKETRKEELEKKSEEELKIMISKIESTLPQLKEMKDEISYENISTVQSRFEYKMTYMRMFTKIESFEYELGLIFIFNNRLDIKNFILDYVHSSNRNNISLFLKKFHNESFIKSSNKPIMFPMKFIKEEYSKENDLPKGYLLDINKKMTIEKNGTINQDIELLIGIDKETFNKKITQWEGKQLTMGKKYEVQRYMTFSVEYFKNKIGISEMKSQIFTTNQSVKNRYMKKIRDIIVNTPFNATNIEEEIQNKFNYIFHLASDKAHFITSAKTINIVSEKENYYIVKIEVNQLSLDEDMLKLNKEYLNRLHTFNYIQNNSIEMPILPKIE